MSHIQDTGHPISRVLGIETSCDETAAAVVDHGTTIVSSVVSSQIDLHARYGGVVPELASRAHVELLTPVVADALEQAGSDHTGRGIDGIAVTHGPGLIGSLLVGVAEAKALSMAWGVPLVGVNHLEAHLFASLLEQPDLGWPLVVLLVSGGHTLLIEVTAPGDYRVMGGTIDDAAGEAFDKVARFIGLGYPGGPAIDQLAPEGNPKAFAFPRSMPGDGYDFSFSGLKTSWSPGPAGPPPTWAPGRCAWPAGWRPTPCCGRASRRLAMTMASERSCRPGRCAPTTPPWWLLPVIGA
jgi:N6-L-threonylcarbamoyladenine synthase